MGYVIAQLKVQKCGLMQMAPPALNAVVALLCCAPGMHVLSRKCCSALCQAGIAPPLIGLLALEPDGPRCTEVWIHNTSPDAASLRVDNKQIWLFIHSDASSFRSLLGNVKDSTVITCDQSHAPL